MRAFGILGALAGAAVMSASAPSQAAGPPPNGGTIFVTATNARDDDDTSTRMSANAASKALETKGFIRFDDPGHAAYVADVTVRRTDVGTGQEKVHAGSASILGGGVSVPFSTGQSRLVPLERTEVAISIHRRGEQSVLWHGAAVTVRVAGSRDGAADTVASVLSAAALWAYPREAAEVVGVP